VSVVHWDEVEPYRRQHGHIDSLWHPLSRRAGSLDVAVNLVRVAPERWSTPVHFHSAEEEIFYIVDGDGLSWQDGKVYEVRAGDCIVHGPRREAHSLRAGESGLDYLVYAGRVRTETAHLPRAGVSWVGPAWTDSIHGWGAFDREAEVGEPPVGEVSGRRSNIVNIDVLEPDDEGDRVLGGTAGARRSGLHHRTMPPGTASVPAHCHSAEEEFFVILDGTATLDLIPSPVPAARGVTEERHELRAGHVVARPPGTKVSHDFHAGDEGATMLVYGTQEPNDIAYYPRSNKFYLRGVGIIGRIEPLDYWDGEPTTPA
jgi:uncharacterized cupin superfamily protein